MRLWARKFVQINFQISQNFATRNVMSKCNILLATRNVMSKCNILPIYVILADLEINLDGFSGPKPL